MDLIGDAGCGLISKGNKVYYRNKKSSHAWGCGLISKGNKVYYNINRFF